MVLVKKTMELEDKFIKIINQKIKDGNINENKLFNKIIEKGLETLELEEQYDCEAFKESMKSAKQEIKDGKFITGDLDELSKRYGL